MNVDLLMMAEVDFNGVAHSGTGIRAGFQVVVLSPRAARNPHLECPRECQPREVLIRAIGFRHFVEVTTIEKARPTDKWF
jgi:hypothetical protein